MFESNFGSFRVKIRVSNFGRVFDSNKIDDITSKYILHFASVILCLFEHENIFKIIQSHKEKFLWRKEKNPLTQPRKNILFAF